MMKMTIKKEFFGKGHMTPISTMVDGNDNFMQARVKDAVVTAYDAWELEMDNLGNYTNTEVKILEFLKKEGLDLWVTPNNVSPCFISGKYGYMAVVMPLADLTGNAVETTIKLAHEASHYLDFKHNYHFDYEKFGDLNDTQKGTMVAEVSAWHYAELMLEELGFFEDINNKFYSDELKEYCLGTYAMSADEYAYYIENQKEIVENHEKGIYPEVDFEPDEVDPLQELLDMLMA